MTLVLLESRTRFNRAQQKTTQVMFTSLYILTGAGCNFSKHIKAFYLGLVRGLI